MVLINKTTSIIEPILNAKQLEFKNCWGILTETKIFGDFLIKIGTVKNVPRGTTLFYLPMKTKSTLMSEGDTPLIREAWEIVTGRIAFSFSRASNERDFNLK